MDTPKPADPNQVEAHTQAHREAFDSLMERIGKACERVKDQQRERPLGSRTHRQFPPFGRIDR